MDDLDAIIVASATNTSTDTHHTPIGKSKNPSSHSASAPSLSSSAASKQARLSTMIAKKRARRKTIIDQNIQYKVDIDDLPPNTTVPISPKTEFLQATLSWKARSKMGTDLDINALTYDQKGRFQEMIAFTTPSSIDASVAMSGDSDGLNGADEEMLAVNLVNISPKIKAVVLLGTSLSGSFQSVSQIRSVVKSVTYMKDEMAVRVGVPLFKTHKVIDSQKLFNIGVSPALADESNCLVLYKLYRTKAGWSANIILKEVSRERSEREPLLN